MLLLPFFGLFDLLCEGTNQKDARGEIQYHPAVYSPGRAQTKRWLGSSFGNFKESAAVHRLFYMQSGSA